MSRRLVNPLSLLLGVPVLLASVLFAVTLDKRNSVQQPLALTSESDRGVALPALEEVSAVEPKPEEVPVAEKVEITTTEIELPKSEEIDQGPLPGPRDDPPKKLIKKKPVAEKRVVSRAEPRTHRKITYRKRVYNREQSWADMMSDRYDRTQNYEGYRARFGRIK